MFLNAKKCFTIAIAEVLKYTLLYRLNIEQVTYWLYVRGDVLFCVISLEDTSEYKVERRRWGEEWVC